MNILKKFNIVNIENIQYWALNQNYYWKDHLMNDQLYVTSILCRIYWDIKERRRKMKMWKMTSIRKSSSNVFWQLRCQNYRPWVSKSPFDISSHSFRSDIDNKFTSFHQQPTHHPPSTTTFNFNFRWSMTLLVVFLFEICYVCHLHYVDQYPVTNKPGQNVHQIETNRINPVINILLICNKKKIKTWIEYKPRGPPRLQTTCTQTGAPAGWCGATWQTWAWSICNTTQSAQYKLSNLIINIYK